MLHQALKEVMQACDSKFFTHMRSLLPQGHWLNGSMSLFVQCSTVRFCSTWNMDFASRLAVLPNLRVCREVDEELANEIRNFRSPTDDETRMFYEIVIAPSYSPAGLERLKGKSKTLRILEATARAPEGRQLRQVAGMRPTSSSSTNAAPNHSQDTFCLAACSKVLVLLLQMACPFPKANTHHLPLQ